MYKRFWPVVIALRAERRCPSWEDCYLPSPSSFIADELMACADRHFKDALRCVKAIWMFGFYNQPWIQAMFGVHRPVEDIGSVKLIVSVVHKILTKPQRYQIDCRGRQWLSILCEDWGTRELRNPGQAFEAIMNWHLPLFKCTTEVYCAAFWVRSAGRNVGKRSAILCALWEYPINLVKMTKGDNDNMDHFTECRTPEAFTEKWGS